MSASDGTFPSRLKSKRGASTSSASSWAICGHGNRRWARSSGVSSAHGHRRGADKIAELLEWSEDVGVEVVTLWMLSTDNLERDKVELGHPKIFYR